MMNAKNFFLFLSLLLSSQFTHRAEAFNDYVQRAFFTSKEIQRDHYLSQVQPILDKRCVVCHSCFEAPCQLKLTSYEMLRRGAIKESPIGGFIFPSKRTDLDFTSQDQRSAGFHSVIKGGINSLLFNVLAQGQNKEGIPAEKYVKPDNRSCIQSGSQFSRLSLEKKKTLGMPYYMSPLSEAEYGVLMNWVAAGALPPSEEAMDLLNTPRNPKAVKEWEDFFNTPTWKGRWTSRYLYEHLYTAHLYIEASPGDFFQLVRSSTPAPEKIKIIPTKRPFVMPLEHQDKFTYRLKKVNTTILQKEHFVYRLNSQIMQELKDQFWKVKWQGSEKTAPFNFTERNPFIAFKHIPAMSRYRWMLKNARMLLDMDMRSDNCHGKGATGPLRDDFISLFVKPESDVSVMFPDFFDHANKYLTMANTEGEGELRIIMNNARMNTQFSRNQEGYGAIKAGYQKRLLKEGMQFSDIWDGEKGTQTPIFTILRHDTTVSVHDGVWGPVPRNTLLWDYASFERLYYNCVALITLFDRVNDKVGAVVYLRKVGREAEEQILSLLPEELRTKVRKDWVRGLGAKQDFKSSIFSTVYNKAVEIKGRPLDRSRPYESMMTNLFLYSGRFDKKTIGDRFYPVSVDTEEYAQLKEATQFMSREQRKGEGNRATHFPNVSYLVVKSASGPNRFYSLIVNRFFEFVNVIDLLPLGKLESGRIPQYDRIIAFPNVVANYPTKIYQVAEEDYTEFINDMKSVNSREEYVRFDKTYGLQKMSSDFWPMIDQIQEHFIKQDIIGHGQLDLGEYGQHDLLGSR